MADASPHEAAAPLLPDRYEPVRRLGRGGGGEVWAVRDRYAGRELALKVLTGGYGPAEVDALVRETVALSGLEGLGLPWVSSFGRLADGRPYLLRELVEGRSLEEALDESSGANLIEWLAGAADVLTRLHRAGLLHGDIKPANVIVGPGGVVSLVDLGLAAAWQERGAVPEGLTPRYASPEVLAGTTLTARSEVYSLGVVLGEILQWKTDSLSERQRLSLEAVFDRATRVEPAERYPSADEFASALRRAASLPAPPQGVPDDCWPVEGMDHAAAGLLKAIEGLPAGGILRVQGPEGSGRTTLLRRVTWTLAVSGVDVIWLDERLCADPAAVAGELDPARACDVVLVDPPLSALTGIDSLREFLRARLERGARVVLTGDLELGKVAGWFDVPALDFVAVRRLLKRAMPSVTDAMIHRVLEATRGRPGALRRLVARAGSAPLTSSDDLEQLLAWDETLAAPPLEPLEAAAFYLDRGRFSQARSALDRALDRGAPDGNARQVWLEARWQLGAGSAARALQAIEAWSERGERVDPELEAYLNACRGRALLGVGCYADALEVLRKAESFPPRPRVEALAYRGLAESLLGHQESAASALRAALELAEELGSRRLEALAAASFATARGRAERPEEAAQLYRRAIAAAEAAGDAGILSSAQINLAALFKVQGEFAAALEMLESAVDTARRSGRRATLQQALLNLANADLYLGRLERAKSSIASIDEQALTAVARAQLIGLRAELAARGGRDEEALELYGACEAAWSALERKREAAEAALESILVGVRRAGFERSTLEARLCQAKEHLRDEDSLRPLLALAEAALCLASDAHAAEAACERALEAAEASGQREWLWRGLELHAELLESTGRTQRARSAERRALEVVEEIGASLPRDLREVYWNDPRRRRLRHAVAATEPSTPVAEPSAPLPALPAHPGVGLAAVSKLTQTPLEQRLARILAVNHDLAGEIDLARLCRKIVGHAAELLGAERGFLLLVSEQRELVVQAALGVGAEGQREFSRSIAEQVVQSGEPIVSIDATQDRRLTGYESVHQRMVRGVACVPVLDPRGSVVGALHLETRGAPSSHFPHELPTLQALADQAAIALENARLLAELDRRSKELEGANHELAAARARLEELLQARTARLKEARRELRSTRRSIEAHYTYGGLVGTSEAMRQVYAKLERIKNTDVPVLITGESGTGKEVVARALHHASPRAARRFLGVNCGAIPEQLLESELFGHVRGAFTGADRDRRGLFREADGGSLLLDEIGETPPKMQVGLLRVLQEGTVRPVGGRTEEPVDVRLIFATNRDLATLVVSGEFREDLLYRIRVVELRLPALRERTDDIPQLVDHFFARFAARFGRPKKSLSRRALERLFEYSWPGNVRQLENALLNAWVLSEGDVIEAEDLALPRETGSASHARSQSELPAPSSEPERSKRDTASQHRRDERRRIVDALHACNWNRVKAAELVGMPRRTFYRRLRQYGIQ